VTTLRDDTSSVGELTLGGEDGGRVEPLFKTSDELLSSHGSPLELHIRSALGVVLENLEEGVDGSISREVVFVGDVFTFFGIRREELGTPRTVEESTSDILKSEHGWENGDTELDRARSGGVSLPVASKTRRSELRTANGSSQVVVGGETSGLERTEHVTPSVFTSDGLPIVEVDNTVDVPLGGAIIIRPRVLPGGTVRSHHRISHLVLGSDHTVEVGTSTSGGGLGIGITSLGVEVSGVGGVGDGLEGRTSNLLGTIQVVRGVGTDVGNTTRITLVSLTSTSSTLVENVGFVDVGDLVKTPKREGDLPSSSIVQVETETSEGTFLNSDHGIESSEVTILIEGTNGEVGLRSPVDLTVGKNIIVGTGETKSRFEDVEEPQDVIGIRLGGVGHVRVLGDVGGADVVRSSTSTNEVLRRLSFMFVLEAFVLEVREITHVVIVGVIEDVGEMIRDKVTRSLAGRNHHGSRSQEDGDCESRNSNECKDRREAKHSVAKSNKYNSQKNIIIYSRK